MQRTFVSQIAGRENSVGITARQLWLVAAVDKQPLQLFDLE